MRKAISLVIPLIMLVACSPSPEALTTQTASAWTPTSPSTPLPTSTPTSTAVPFTLEISAVDEAGNPIQGIEVGFTGPEAEQMVKISEQDFFWKDLPDESVDVSITAQGYLTSKAAETLHRGNNELVITLTRDPHGLLPEDLTEAGGELIWVKDFQSQSHEFLPVNGNWSVAEEQAAPGNFVLEIDQTGAEDFVSADLPAEFSDFTNFSLGFRFRYLANPTDKGMVDIPEANDVSVDFGDRYKVWVEPYWKVIEIMDVTLDDWVPLRSVGRTTQGQRWYSMKITVIEHEVLVSLDGQLLGSAKDLNEGQGVISLIIGNQAGIVQFDDFVLLGID